MTTAVFPFLVGAGWPVNKKQTWSAVVAAHTSGREVRTQLWQNPVWEFEMTINALDSSTNGMYGAVGARSLQTLLGFYGMMAGSFGTFIYYDVTDYYVAPVQTFGVGDGATTTFQLIRTLGGMTESVIAPVNSATTLYFNSGNVAAIAPEIYSNGTLVGSSTYSIVNGAVTFNTPPISGAVLTWTGYFGFLCRFSDDNLEFSQTMWNLWEAKSVKFKSLRAI